MAEISYEIDDQGAPMDYPEHEQTYSLFLFLTKWGIILNIALLVGMAVGFFGGGAILGIFSAIIVLIVARFIS